MSKIQVLDRESGERLETIEGTINKLVDLYQLRKTGGWEGMINLDWEITTTGKGLSQAVKDYAMSQIQKVLAT